MYLREEMAESDRASQIQSAQRIGRKEGEILKLISLVQKKILKNKNFATDCRRIRRRYDSN